MAMNKIPILRPITTGYRDAWYAIRTMPVLAVYAVIIIFAISLLEYVFPLRSAEGDLFGGILSFAISAVQNFFLTPIMIAVHRYIILDEVASGYGLATGKPAFRAFFGWLLALSALGVIAFLIFSPDNTSSLVSLGVVMIVMVLIIIVMTRLSILFPAIATEAPGATAANAWADSKSNTFRIFVIFLLAVLPIIAGAILFIVPFALSEGEVQELGLVPIAIMAVVQTFFLILCVAIASRLYQALADRLLGHPQPQ
jgi:hypothetical protein